MMNTLQAETLKLQIKNFIESKFPLARRKNVKPEDPLLENGLLDSMGILDLVGYLEEEYGISLADEDLVPENFQTIDRLVSFVIGKTGGRVGNQAEE